MHERPGGLALRFVDAAEIQRVLTFPRLIAEFEAAHRRPKIEVQDGFLGSEGEQYFVRHAVDRGRYFGSKLITSFPGNLEGGDLPAVQAVCVLFDGVNGRPLAVMDGTEITYWRTAADSALGASFLAPAQALTLLVVGAGQMCRWLVRAHNNGAAIGSTRADLEPHPPTRRGRCDGVEARGNRCAGGGGG